MRSFVVVSLIVGCSGPASRSGDPGRPVSDVRSSPPIAAAAPVDAGAARSVDPAENKKRVVWTFVRRYENRTALRDLKKQCSEAAARLANDRGIHDVSSCAVEQFSSAGRSLHLVRLRYGPVMDCPSGCIQRSVSGVVEGHVVRPGRIPYAAPGTAHGYIKGALGSVLPDLGINNPDRYGWYDTKAGFPCANDKQPRLVSRGADLWWEYDLSTRPRCLARLPGPGVTPLGVEVELSGRVVLPIFVAKSSSQQPDYSGVVVDVVKKP